MKILLTGGAGFIGSHLADSLLKLNYEVYIIDDLSGGYTINLPTKAKYINCNIFNYDSLKSLFTAEKFDFVFHLAAYAAENLSHFVRLYNYNTNLIGSINLINLSILNNVKCFVFISSAAVYGDSKGLLTETSICSPIDPYGIAKRAVEMDLIAAKKIFDLNYIIFRLHNVYGERQNINDKYRNVIGIFLRQLLTNKPITVFGDGNQNRYFTYIMDIMDALSKCITLKESYNQIFNLGNDKSISIEFLVKTLIKVTGYNPEILFFPERSEIKHQEIDHSLAKNLFKTTISTSIEDGLSKMANWLISNKELIQPYNDLNVEIPIELPNEKKKT